MATVDLLWRQLAQRRFTAAEATLTSVSGQMDAESAARARALLTLHRDGVAAALRLAPLPHDVFLQCFERAADRRDVALTQLRACARACNNQDSPASVLLAYEEALEFVVFRLLLPAHERASAVSLLLSDRWLTPEKRALFLRLVDEPPPPPVALTPGVAAHDTRAIRPRRLSFDEQQQQPQPQVPSVEPPVAEAVRAVPGGLDRRRWWLLFLLGSTSVIAVYRAWLWWRRPRQLLAN